MYTRTILIILTYIHMYTNCDASAPDIPFPCAKMLKLVEPGLACLALTSGMKEAIACLNTSTPSCIVDGIF